MSLQPEPKRPGRAPAHFRYLTDPTVLMKRHLHYGWWILVCFVCLGVGLATLHGFKVASYASPGLETRRTLWLLAYAHGVLLGLLHLGFGFSVRLLPEWSARERAVASLCLRTATLLMPVGFMLGGWILRQGDPGWGVLLVPVGAMFLIVAVFLTACGVSTFRIELHGTRR